jgi:hypothetical protein
MNEDQAINVVGLVAIISFIGFGLLRQRHPAHVWQTMVPLWTGIIGAAWLIVDLVLKWRAQ